MAVPKITPEERAKALQKAQQVRKDRAALREKMKAGAMTMKDVIDKKDDDIVGGMRVKYSSGIFARIGKVRAKN